MKTRITKLFDIEYPIVQAGMIWTSGWRLASAVSNAGGLGVIGAGSMYPDVLNEHIIKCKAVTNKPFAVNLPLLYPDIEAHIECLIAHKVPIVITSAGNPTAHTGKLKAAGITVVHVVSSSKFAQKAQSAGCDAVVAEGFEAGGHNGREETTTLVLVPSVVRAVTIPVIAAGGIATGEQMAAAFCLGAAGVQIGSLFVATPEASSHPTFKTAVIAANEGDTHLSLKQLTPVRLLKNKFYHLVADAERRGASLDELKLLLGRARAKLGMFEGNMDEGELEIGQVASMIDDLVPAATRIEQLMNSLRATFKRMEEF